MADADQGVDTIDESAGTSSAGFNDTISGEMGAQTDNSNAGAGDSSTSVDTTENYNLDAGTDSSSGADTTTDNTKSPEGSESSATEDPATDNTASEEGTESSSVSDTTVDASDNANNSNSPEAEYSVPDQGFNFFLIHLSDSKYRYDTVIPKLNEQGINYQIVGVNGTQVQFWHNATNTYFTGAKLVEDNTTLFSRGNHQLNKYQKYNVTCDPDSSSPTKFPYNGFDINAGQIGQLCSHIKCWQEAEKGGYKHTVIMTDNALPAAGLKDNLAYMVDNAPENYDYIFLAVNQTDGGSIKYNDFLSKFTPDARFNNVLGVMISQQGLKKLLSDYDIPFNTDIGVYYYEAATCSNVNWNIFCRFAPFFDGVNAYVSTIPMLSLYDSESVMGTMGPVKDVLGVMKIGDI